VSEFAGAVEITGAEDVAKVVLARGTPFAPFARPAVVDGQAGAAVVFGGGCALTSSSRSRAIGSSGWT
jgi:hypothetical protein